MPQKDTEKPSEVTAEELAKQQGEPLPERDVMSILYPHPVPPDGLYPVDPSGDGEAAPPGGNAIEPPPPLAPAD